MAIDFMVMPMSCYISGDFITPTMRWAWEQGIPYAVVEPDGKRELPKNSPFGGTEAAERRGQMVEMILEDLRGLPSEISQHLWDERSKTEHRFHRVDPGSYQALLEHFSANPPDETEVAHCIATLFLPCDLEGPLPLTTPLERIAGATNRALEELERSKYPAAAASAAETLRKALEDSAALRLPMIVDW